MWLQWCINICEGTITITGEEASDVAKQEDLVYKTWSTGY